jgi:hypothetical protein
VHPETVRRLELQRAIDRPQRVGQALHLAQQPAREVPPVRIVRVVMIQDLARLQRLPQVTGLDAACDRVGELRRMGQLAALYFRLDASAGEFMHAIRAPARPAWRFSCARFVLADPPLPAVLQTRRVSNDWKFWLGLSLALTD